MNGKTTASPTCGNQSWSLWNFSAPSLRNPRAAGPRLTKGTLFTLSVASWSQVCSYLVHTLPIVYKHPVQLTLLLMLLRWRLLGRISLEYVPPTSCQPSVDVSCGCPHRLRETACHVGGSPCRHVLVSVGQWLRLLLPSVSMTQWSALPLYHRV